MSITMDGGSEWCLQKWFVKDCWFWFPFSYNLLLDYSCCFSSCDTSFSLSLSFFFFFFCRYDLDCKSDNLSKHVSVSFTSAVRQSDVYLLDNEAIFNQLKTKKQLNIESSGTNQSCWRLKSPQDFRRSLRASPVSRTRRLSDSLCWEILRRGWSRLLPVPPVLFWKSRSCIAEFQFHFLDGLSHQRPCFWIKRTCVHGLLNLDLLPTPDCDSESSGWAGLDLWSGHLKDSFCSGEKEGVLAGLRSLVQTHAAMLKRIPEVPTCLVIVSSS